MDFSALAARYRSALLDDVLPFWEEKSPDIEHGGYFTCLRRDGSVYDTDKFTWLQGRQVWVFSKMYNEIERRPSWLDHARLGAGFLAKHGMDPSGNFYFSLTREGTPLTQPHSIFSDCFAAMAFSEFGKATKEAQHADLALRTFRNILARRENPKGPYGKGFPGTRPLRSFTVPMILLNLTEELAWLLPKEEYSRVTGEAVREITEVFLDPATGIASENVAPDGRRVDCFEGRLLNPGHTIEGTWFLLDVARRTGDSRLITLAVDAMLKTLERGWDTTHGGIFYFLDSAGNPPDRLEWDQKLWWVHVEALVAAAMGYALTGNAECLAWLERLDAYTWKNFPDPAFGEWFGYLNRRGEVLLDLKGGKWKGCFHVPRGLYRCALLFEEIARTPLSLH
jgi:N-acylglucosamine 2-epimerase